jgi:alpha-L-rhamnosidase
MKSNPGLTPALYLRKHFTTDSTVKEARLYATAQGVYKVIINGQQVSDSHLDPGWTDFSQTIQYQTYDVTHLISKDNAIAVMLGTGWFSGYVGGKYHNYGTDQSLLLQLHIEYADNKTLVVASDNSWRITTGPIVYSDREKGELYYENRALHGWVYAKYDDSKWSPVVTKQIDKKVMLVSDKAEPIRVIQELKPKTVWQSSPGVYVFDLGQNMVGWVKIRIATKNKSIRLQLRHAEVLNPDGSIYTQNLRSARATDTYVFEGKQIFFILIKFLGKKLEKLFKYLLKFQN